MGTRRKCFGCSFFIELFCIYYYINVLTNFETGCIIKLNESGENMPKTVYSLVLSDEIVAGVDALAVSGGYSRSGLINHILAEYLNLTSPEKRLRQVADALEAQAVLCGFRGSRSPGGMPTLRTALQYKYNPSLCYTVELRDAAHSLGRVNVSLRSQNDTLLGYFALFFQLWQRLENAHLPQPPGREHHRAEEKKYTRTLRRPARALSDEEAGQSIADYISLLDGCLKIYFRHLDNAAVAFSETERQYLEALAENAILKSL